MTAANAPHNILLFEDDPDLVNLLEFRFKREGFEIVSMFDVADTKIGGDSKSGVPPSSVMSDGTTASGLTARYSGFSCSPCIRLTEISSALMPFSASAMRRRPAWFLRTVPTSRSSVASGLRP